MASKEYPSTYPSTPVPLAETIDEQRIIGLKPVIVNQTISRLIAIDRKWF